MITNYRYLFKLHNGKIKYGEGADLEQACRDAGTSLSEVKRHMPVAVVLTPEEKKEKAKTKQHRRRRAIALLKKARKAKTAK